MFVGYWLMVRYGPNQGEAQWLIGIRTATPKMIQKSGLHLALKEVLHHRWRFLVLPQHVRDQSILNPLPALMEQWFSNPEFRADPITRIDAMTQTLCDLGFNFRANFAEQQVAPFTQE
ncbi:hypothetical protein AB7M29_002793 [Pseudomonas sp. F-14 TE3623]